MGGSYIVGSPRKLSSAGHRAGLTLRDPGGGYHWLDIEQIFSEHKKCHQQYIHRVAFRNPQGRISGEHRVGPKEGYQVHLISFPGAHSMFI
jgi:hypothetical protein